MNTYFIKIISGVLLLSVFFLSCRKENFLTQGGSISFSSDTLTFDTVFTAQGSATRSIKIYNNQNQPIRISSIKLQGGSASPFKLNVDGAPGNAATDIEIAPSDSLYVFATVTIDPTSADAPFIVEDQLIANLNGSTFSVPVIAFGQNANYIFDSVLTTQTWTKDKPYVIINNALVDSGEVLSIDPGCRIYLHANSRLFVDGTLVANGTKNDSIVFQGDRIDRAYFDYLDLPGEWGGLYFTRNSTGNVLRHTTIKNGGSSTRLGESLVQAAAIQVDKKAQAGAPLQLLLDRVTIINSIGFGILSFGGEVKAQNCLIANCGSQNVAAIQGADFTFENSTLATFGSSYLSHSENSVLGLLNYLDTSQTGFIPGDLNATFTNCIVYGTLENEVVILKKGSAQHQVTFTNCLLKVKTADLPNHVGMNSVLLNTDPEFEDEEKWNFRLKTSSPCIDYGIVLPGFSVDRDDNVRTGNYDLGCYEAP